MWLSLILIIWFGMEPYSSYLLSSPLLFRQLPRLLLPLSPCLFTHTPSSCIFEAFHPLLTPRRPLLLAFVTTSVLRTLLWAYHRFLLPLISQPSLMSFLPPAAQEGPPLRNTCLINYQTKVSQNISGSQQQVHGRYH